MPSKALPKVRIATFDPLGETTKLLADLGIGGDSVDANADLAAYDLLVIGKGALTPDGPGPDVRRVRDGLRVIVFEQSAKTLERRFGFRATEYGLREVFPRVPDHPVLAGLPAETLHDWRGEATLVSPRLDYKLVPQHGPTVKWCDIDVSRCWRCGNRGNVASVLIEKPARGDFLPIVDGGYALQFSPLLEYREGKGVVLFCQLDVSGRTESEPAAQVLASNLIRYAATWKAGPSRTAMYAGEPAGKRHLEAAGFTLGGFDMSKATRDTVLIVGPGGGKELAPHAADVARKWLRSKEPGRTFSQSGSTTRRRMRFRRTRSRRPAASTSPPGSRRSRFGRRSPASLPPTSTTATRARCRS